MLRFLPVVALLSLCLSLSAQDPTDAQHVLLNIEINPSTQVISGTCTWTVRCAVTGLSSMTLQLHNSFAVSNVRVNGSATASTRPTDAVTITLDHTYVLNEVFTVALDYTGTPSGAAGFGSFAFQTHGSPATSIINSLSEPYYSYTWWPCKETLTDKFTTETWVTVPSTLYVASNGLLQGTDILAGGRTRYRWSSNYPIATYGVSVTATNYQIRTDSWANAGPTMPVSFYAYPESFAGEQTNMDRIVPMLTTFSSLVGQYPFVNEKYGICQFNWGGGMEHQTITSQVNFSENLSAHELGHSWWGNCITCATWHDISLNEGFATYMEALWDQNKAGGTLATYFTRMNANKPASPTTTGSVYVNDISNVNSIFSTTNVYHKGAWVLHQLRHVVGDAAFFQILADYRTAKDYQSATWDEFKAIASVSYGQDLTWLIDQCVYRTGAPTFRLSWDNRTVNGQTFVVGNVEQTQTALAYRYPVDIQVTTAAGQTTHVVWTDQKRDDFTLLTNGAATAVVLDPAPWILRGTTATGTFAPSLTTSTATVPRTGGTATFTLNAGTGNGLRGYLIGASATGISPGITLLDGKQIPLVLDSFTYAALGNVNTPTFANFSGALSPTGTATAQLVVPPLPPLAGPITLHFAFISSTTPVFTSTPVTVTITP
ncbi:MAG: M1 family peptidase [Planctomycetes bacterium]|nr:M1 family peptidase [Planctomycetota bacterium]